MSRSHAERESGHLPECPASEKSMTSGRAEYMETACRTWGICDRLHAAETRVELEQRDHLRSHRDEWVNDGFMDALKKADDAIWEHECVDEDCSCQSFISAAVHALGGETPAGELGLCESGQNRHAGEAAHG